MGVVERFYLHVSHLYAGIIIFLILQPVWIKRHIVEINVYVGHEEDFIIKMISSFKIYLYTKHFSFILGRVEND